MTYYGDSFTLLFFTETPRIHVTLAKGIALLEETKSQARNTCHRQLAETTGVLISTIARVGQHQGNCEMNRHYVTGFKELSKDGSMKIRIQGFRRWRGPQSLALYRN
jgi:hypothetical protein